MVEHFDQHCFRCGAPGRADCDAFDDTHGRLVRRRVFASAEAASLKILSGWPGLRSVLAVESIRSVNNASGKVETEIRYFLSSCPDGPAVLGQAVRAHWAVENALHWVLDVTFREDDSRVRDRTAARNLALLRKIAINLVGRDQTTKASVRAKRKRPPGMMPICPNSWSGSQRSPDQTKTEFHALPLGMGWIRGDSPGRHGPAGCRMQATSRNNSASGHAVASAIRTRVAVSVMCPALPRS